MSSYNYDCFITDFAKRTRANIYALDFLKNNMDVIPSKELHNDEEIKIFEVTQLINSLFGLFIVPRERYKFRKGQSETTEKSLKKTGEPYYAIKSLIDKVNNENRYYCNFIEEPPVSGFLTHMRNALAHSGDEGLHFTPMSEGSIIKTVIFYDRGKNKIGDFCEFCIELDIDEIRELSISTSEMYSIVEQSNESLRRYNDIIDKRRALFLSNEKNN